MDKKSFVLVVNEFWGCVGLSFEEYCWLDWFCVMFVKGKCDAPFPRGHVDHRKPAENLCVLYHETHTSILIKNLTNYIIIVQKLIKI